MDSTSKIEVIYRILREKSLKTLNGRFRQYGEDILHSAILRALEGRVRVESIGEGYLYMTAVNVGRDEVKHRVRSCYLNKLAIAGEKAVERSAEQDLLDQEEYDLLCRLMFEGRRFRIIREKVLGGKEWKDLERKYQVSTRTLQNEMKEETVALKKCLGL